MSDVNSSLSVAQRLTLRGRAQNLPVALQIGQAGLTPNVLAELERRLEQQALIKIKLPKLDRSARAALLLELAQAVKAEVVGQVGHTASLWRGAAKPEAQSGGF